MSKKWITLCLAGCFGVVLGIAGMGSSSAYAAEGKKLAMEGAVFDLKASSSLTVYGYVSDKAFHPVSDAKVTAKPLKGASQSATSESNGGYILNVEPGQTYTLSASKVGLGSSKRIKLNIKKGEESDFIVNFQFKKIER
ncbi:MAG TPA: carboxypeptidase-like regulatory domain-containing protein [Candidatus Wunengus sp. YC60]|uniref:carboxypeptidase-like regulatory domain-containing protein n=1 Tax=Candidatus Wunengus sp. YC60 TaxID=3367697 RepID=UPI004026E49F